MTDLRELMHQTVEHDHADLVRLAARARKHGTTLRRRRRLALAASSSFAVLAILGSGITAAGGLLPGDDSSEATSVADHGPGTPASTPLTELEALEAALARVVPGGTTSRDVRAMSPHGEIDLGHEMLEFARADGAPWTVIDVDYDVATERSHERVSQCPESREACEVLTLPDGSVLQTWEEPYDYGSTGSGTNLRAERLVNGHVVRIGAVDLVEDGDASALTRNEFKAVASQPEWAHLVPAG